MELKLHEYQRYAADFIIKNPISALFLDCGLGKTAITLAALNELMLDRFEVRKVLVVAPLRVGLTVWPQELKQWDCFHDLTYAVAIGTEKQRKAALRQNAMITIINRENVSWLVNESGEELDFDMLVIDEMSSFKHHTSQRFKALVMSRNRYKRVVGLTATPATNGLIDLWAQFRILDYGKRLGRFIGKFRDTYFNPGKTNGTIVYSYTPKPGAEKKIYSLIDDITVSMKADDHLKMPECLYRRYPVMMSPMEYEQYEKLKRDMVVSLHYTPPETALGDTRDENSVDHEERVIELTAANAAVLSGKLLQMANGAVYDEDKRTVYIHDRKLDALEDLVEAANGNPVLIAYWYQHDLERIRSRLKVEELKGSDSIRRWNNGEIPVAVIHPASAGHGLNLQNGGSTLIWFGLTWSLELYQQTNARIWRQGQKRTVVIQHIISVGTIDEDVLKALADKSVTQNRLIAAVKANYENLGQSERNKKSEV
ncbi:MAG: DEAD/DEAH box helicase [Clostridiales bacterium GWF2_38_85]|nr:MAG: DEAD/DEAH box helicase [Clostridiales bacterium GWF2_38_85]HBL84713.1 DEAD/DEAH box helicase [Clostridiales bacterium]